MSTPCSVPAGMWDALEIPRCCTPCRRAAFDALNHAVAVDAFRMAEEAIAEGQTSSETWQEGKRHAEWLAEWMRFGDWLGRGLAVILSEGVSR